MEDWHQSGDRACDGSIEQATLGLTDCVLTRRLTLLATCRSLWAKRKWVANVTKSGFGAGAIGRFHHTQALQGDHPSYAG
jgi:hypothetical protein